MSTPHGDPDALERQIAELKAELDSFRPLGPSTLAAIRKPYDLELTYSSNAIEGNTLTLRETAEVIEHGVTFGGKSLRHHLEAQDHHNALEWMYDIASKTELVTENVIRQLHNLILNRSQPDIAGQYATTNRTIKQSNVVFPGPFEVPALMGDLASKLQKSKPTPRSAFDAHYGLVSIHPFADGNGRTARLLMNLLLVRGGYRPVAIRPEDRSDYLDSLETGQLVGDVAPYQKFMHQRLADTMQDYVTVIREAQRTTAEIERRRAQQDELNR